MGNNLTLCRPHSNLPIMKSIVIIWKVAEFNTTVKICKKLFGSVPANLQHKV